VPGCWVLGAWCSVGNWELWSWELGVGSWELWSWDLGVGSWELSRSHLVRLYRRCLHALPVDVHADAGTCRHRDHAAGADLDAGLDQIRREVAAARRDVTWQ